MFRWKYRLAVAMGLSCVTGFMCLWSTTYCPKTYAGVTEVKVASYEMVKLVSSDISGVTLEYTPSEPICEEEETPFGRFQAITLQGHGSLAETGRPALPRRGISLAIPDDAEPRLSFEILETEDFPRLRPMPSQEGTGKDPEGVIRRKGFSFDPSVYEQGKPTPPIGFRYEEAGHFRFHRVGSVVVTPMQYRLGQGVRLVKRALVRVDFVSHRNAGIQARRERIAVPREVAWEDTYQKLFLNYEAAKLFRSRALPDFNAVESSNYPGLLGAPTHTEYRMRVNQTGVYSVSYADLAAIGWPKNVNLDDIRLFDCDGPTRQNPSNPPRRQVPIRIEEGSIGSSGVFDGEDIFYFLGLNYKDRYKPAIKDARYTSLHSYWVTWDTGTWARMSETPGWYEGPTFVTPTSFVQQDRYEEEHFYHFDPPDNGAQDLDPVPRNSNVYWLGPYDDSPAELPFETAGRDASRPVQVRARWQGYFPFRHYLRLAISKGASGNDNRDLTSTAFDGDYELLYDSGLEVPGDRLADGVNRFKIQGNGSGRGDPESAGSGALLDWFEVTWSRHYVADAGKLRFTTGSSQGDVELDIRDLSSSLPYVFDVTDSLAPKWVDLTGATFTRIQESSPPRFELKFRVNASRQHSYSLYSPSTIPDIHEAVATGSMPPDLGTTSLTADIYLDVKADAGADILVLAHPSFQAALEPWLNLRRSQGHRILVVSPQDVWDQFSGGDKSVPAIREWLRYVYRNWAKAPDYLVIVGDANEDYRHDTDLSDADWVPTMMLYGPIAFSSTPAELVGSDNWYVGSLDPSDPDYNTLPDMHVGRLPVGSPKEAEDLIAKLVAYDQESPDEAWRNRALIVSDDEYSQPATAAGNYCYSPTTDYVFERGGDSLQAVVTRATCIQGFTIEHFRLSSYLNSVPLLGRHLVANDCPDLDTAKNYTIANVRQAWLENMSRGHLVDFYSGHGNHTVMTNEFLVQFNGNFTLPENRVVDQLTNYGKPFVFVGLGCHLNEYEFYQEKNFLASIAERMVLLPGRGAIASIASTGFETVFTNLDAEVYIGRSLLVDVPVSEDGRPRRILGEGFDQGMVRMVTDETDDFHRGTLRTYCLLGDPSMTLDMAPPRLKIWANDIPVQPGGRVTSANGGSTATITALLSDDVDYGHIEIKNDGHDVSARDFQVAPETSPEGCRVERLTWTALLLPATYDITLTATDWKGLVTIFPLKIELEVEWKVNGNPIQPGQTIPPDAPLEATFHSPVPVVAGQFDVTVNNEVGYFDLLRTDSEGRTWQATPRRSLPVGTVQLAATVDGAIARAEIPLLSVTVQGELALSDVFFYPNPLKAGESGGFTYILSFSTGNEPQRIRLAIWSVSGRRIVNLDGSRNLGRNWLPWDIKDGQGDAIANGVYLYTMSVEGKNGSQVTHTDRLVILR